VRRRSGAGCALLPPPQGYLTEAWWLIADCRHAWRSPVATDPLGSRYRWPLRSRL